MQPGQEVRWKKGQRWRHGHLADPPIEPDGSLRIFDASNGSARSLRPAEVDMLERGPRGGRRWVPCDPARWRVIITLYQRGGTQTDSDPNNRQEAEVFEQVAGPSADYPDKGLDLTDRAVARASRYANTHHELRGQRADLVRITMVANDDDLWLSWNPDDATWERRDDPRRSDHQPVVLDSGTSPDPLTLRDILRRQPASWHHEMAVLAL